MNCYPGATILSHEPNKAQKKKHDITSLSNDPPPPISETALLFYHKDKHSHNMLWRKSADLTSIQYINPYPTAFPYGNGMVLHFYQQQESSTTKTVHKVINKGLKAYV